MTERILVHAGIADSRMYRQQVETLAPARAFDLPGFGQEPLAPDTVDYATFVRGQLPADPATLIGTSLGGNIALGLALEAPERVAALVLVGPGLDGHEWSAALEAFDAYVRVVGVGSVSRRLVHRRIFAGEPLIARCWLTRTRVLDLEDLPEAVFGPDRVVVHGKVR